MRIAVIAAAGRTGRLVVDEALARGHEVVAVVRDADAFAEARPDVVSNPRVRVVRADAADSAALEPAMSGADAVISVVGRGSVDRAAVYAAAMRAMLAAMNAVGVERIVLVSVKGLDGDADRQDRLARAVSREALDDLCEMERLVRSSPAAWTIVRPGGLSDAPKTGYTVEQGSDSENHHRTPRSVLAEVLVRAVDERLWVREAILVTAALD